MAALSREYLHIPTLIFSDHKNQAQGQQSSTVESLPRVNVDKVGVNVERDDKVEMEAR